VQEEVMVNHEVYQTCRWW